MISQINRIKNHGLVFRNYKKTEGLPQFRRYNLIYGLNWTGKTSLSRLFEAVAGKAIKGSPELEFEIEDTAGTKLNRGTRAYKGKIKVFSNDYIEDNFKLIEGQANALSVLLGAENVDIQKSIAADEMILKGDPNNPLMKGKRSLLEEARKEKLLKERERGEKLTDIAKVIGVDCVGYAKRTYRRPDAENDIQTISNKDKLDNDAAGNCRTALQQKSMPELDYVPVGKLRVGVEGSNEERDALSVLSTACEELLQRTVPSKRIGRLAEHADISQWIEDGLKLHDAHGSKCCEYCTQEISSLRTIQLSQHFTTDGDSLKDDLVEILRTIEDVRGQLDRLTLPNPAQLYDELRGGFNDAGSRFIETRTQVLVELSQLQEAVKAKHNKTYEKVDLPVILDGEQLLKCLGEINKCIEENNIKTANFDAVKEESYQSLKKHWLSTIVNAIHTLDDSIKSLIKNIDVLQNGDPKNSQEIGIVGIEARIAANLVKISSTEKACAEINDGLVQFLGHDELRFVSQPSGDVAYTGDVGTQSLGFSIERGGLPAISLSEGEKTAIAFVYFTVDLQSHGFELKNGIIVLDDPISSLDIGLLYRTSVYIEKKLKSVHQLFVLTHNYDFFNQIKKWFANAFGDEKDSSAEFFMLGNHFDADSKTRTARLLPLDPLLRDFESEYHYLFKKLCDFDQDNSSEGGTTISVVYNYPNLARKLLECFLAFRVPTRGSFYAKMLKLQKVNKAIPSQDIGVAYQFVNSHSHLDTKSGLSQFDPTLPLNCKENIRLVLRLIELADSKHYRMMKNAVI